MRVKIEKLPERNGQVAQLVERSPEKAGVGGSIPSLATISNNLQTCFSEFGCIWLHFDHTIALRLPLLPTVYER